MPSDPHLQMLVDRLLTGFRGQLEAALRSHADESTHRRTEEVRRTAEAQIAELRGMLDEIRLKAQQHQRVLDARLDEVMRERDDAVASRVRRHPDDTYAQAARLADDVSALDAATALSHVLEHVLSAAGARADRAVLLMTDATRLRVWRTNGFDGAVSDVLELPVDAPGMLGAAARLGRPVSGREGLPRPSFAATPVPHDAAAFPIALARHVVAVLYVDLVQPDDARSAAWPELDVLARHAGTVLEALTFRQAVGLAPVATVARPSQASSASGISGGRVADAAGRPPVGGLQ